VTRLPMYGRARQRIHVSSIRFEGRSWRRIVLVMGFWDWLTGKPKSVPQMPSATVRPADIVPALPPAPPSAPAAPKAPQFDVEKAIELMRKLPLDDDPELVLRIVRKTLRSIGVSIEDVIRSARGRESALAKDIENDRTTIADLERGIAERRANIEKSTAHLAETRKVRESLQDAVASESKVGPLMPPPEVLQAKPEPPKPKPPPAKPSKAPPLPPRSAKPPALVIPPTAEKLPSVAVEEEEEETATREVEISGAARGKDPPA